VSDVTGKAGVLYIVATPIGNLDDISGRALAVLSAADRILAEDTRHSSKLLQHYDIHTPLAAYHDHNERLKVETLVEDLCNGLDLALISDAGTPLINDPGYVLVRAAQDAGIRVCPIPGPSSLLAALSASGLATDRFCYEGFLPAKKVARVTRLEQLARERRTLVLLESSHRIVASLADIKTVFGDDREAVVARELTKHFETIKREKLGALCRWLEGDTNRQKGEFVVLVAGAADTDSSMDEIDRVLGILLEKLPVRDAAAAAAGILGDRKNILYQRALALKSG
jgi:16S rRNA (cytidine1402-2'-O)-methyltransferase